MNYRINDSIEYKCFTYFIDEDQVKSRNIEKLSELGKLQYFRNRMIKNYLKPLKQIFRPNCDLNRYCTGKIISNMNFMIFSFSIMLQGIEILGSFILEPSSKKRERFEIFINKYLPQWQSEVLNLRKMRNDLTHDFGILNGGINTGIGERYKKIGDNIYIDPWILFKDLESAIERYLEDIKHDSSTFVKNFNRLYVRRKSRD